LCTELSTTFVDIGGFFISKVMFRTWSFTVASLRSCVAHPADFRSWLIIFGLTDGMAPMASDAR